MTVTQSIIFYCRQPSRFDDNQLMTVEDSFYSFFYELNSSLADGLHQLEVSDQTYVTTSDIRNMGLHKTDGAFINGLLDSVNLEVTYNGDICDCLPC